MKSRDEVSAGGVVYREGADGPEVLICKASGYHKWVLPKGLIDPGETHEQTALREVREEVGVEAEIVTPLGEPEKYVYTARGMRVFKTVYYYLMRYVSGSKDDHDYEVEDVRWVSFDEAIEMMGFEGGREMLRRARAAFDGETGAAT